MMPAMSASHRRCRLDERVKDDLEIKRRATDDLEHVGSGRLLLQGFCQLARPRLHLLEQPCVLDGDDSLVSEGLGQFNFLVVECRYASAKQRHRANGNSFAQERNAHCGSMTCYSLGLSECVFRIGAHIWDLHRSTFKHGSSDDRSSTR